MDSLKELNKYLRRYKSTFLLGAIFLTGANFFLIWIPVLIRQTMDEVELLGDGYSGEFDSMFTILFSSEAGDVLVHGVAPGRLLKTLRQEECSEKREGKQRSCLGTHGADRY